ncbi:hypothetical protein CH362_19035 [Leptospira saintgironsiae]|uniref:Uncharacterized protein n=1 Tax=Leptospira saintgironsiae TaxID=2023183 RepID=A0A2M9Y7D9_9LEPT|nr:hypothetical protein CH362_19035 [Leptospira saintgironsiae]
MLENLRLTIGASAALRACFATLAWATPHLLLSLRLHEQTRAIANVGTPWSLDAMVKNFRLVGKLFKEIFELLLGMNLLC